MKGFTDVQGRYLAFIYIYSKLHGTPPAESDLQRYFRVTAPAVHQMVLTLDRGGFISRTPGAPRSVVVLVPPSELPLLEFLLSPPTTKVATDDDVPVSLIGPVEQIDGRLLLRIPLAAGGEALMASSRGISRVKDGYLEIEIRAWLAEKLGITEGSRVVVDNSDGKFNITPLTGTANAGE